jgi:peptide/nickel transport system substrate-binding protein
MMVSPTAAAATGKEFGLNPVCSGPFRFAERVAQDHITLERFPGYWDAGSVHFDRVLYRPMTDSAVRLANLRAGSVDLADIVPSDVDAVRTDPKLQLLSSSGLGYAGITLNVGHGPRAAQPVGRDARVRQAFELSLDRDVIVQVVFSGQYTPNSQAISAGSPLFVPDVRPPARDVARAKALLAEAGVTVPVPIPLTVPNNPQSLQVAEVVQSMAQEAGFDVQVTSMDFGASLAATQQGDYVAYLNGWSGLLDADSNTWSFLHTGGPLNIAGYSNANVDAALDQARTVTDPAARRALYGRVWRQQAMDLPIIYLYTPRYIMGARKQVQGYRVPPDGLIRLQGVSLAAP